MFGIIAIEIKILLNNNFGFKNCLIHMHIFLSYCILCGYNGNKSQALKMFSEVKILKFEIKKCKQSLTAFFYNYIFN